MLRLIGASVVAVCAVASAGRFAAVAQRPSVSGDLVSFDFLAVDPDGRPVDDLRREEVTLKLDGHPRDVRSLDLVRLSGQELSHASSLPPPFARIDATPAGQLEMSGLVLGVSRGGRFVPRLQFISDPAAMAYAELHGEPPAGTNLTARLELTRGEAEPPMMALRAHVGPTSEPARRVISGTIAVGALPPGDYLVRLLVNVDDQPVMTAVRTLRRAKP